MYLIHKTQTNLLTHRRIVSIAWHEERVYLMNLKISLHSINVLCWFVQSTTLMHRLCRDGMRQFGRSIASSACFDCHIRPNCNFTCILCWTWHIQLLSVGSERDFESAYQRAHCVYVLPTALYPVFRSSWSCFDEHNSTGSSYSYSFSIV